MNRIKHVFVLAVDFIGLLIIVSLILFTLNYFRILPLSASFPKYFGFLPQASPEKAAIIPTPMPTPSGIVWDKQANPNLVSNYSDYFKNHNIPVAVSDVDSNLFFVSGALTAYNKNYIQIVTSEGPVVLGITNASVLRKMSPTITTKSLGSDSVNRVTNVYTNSADFFSDAPFGGFLQIIYKLNGDIKVATSIDYYPEYKF